MQVLAAQAGFDFWLCTEAGTHDLPEALSSLQEQWKQAWADQLRGEGRSQMHTEDSRAARNPIALSDDIAILTFPRSEPDERPALEKELSELFRNAPVGFIIVNHDGLLNLVNPETERIFGYGAGELNGQPVDRLVPAPHDHAAHRRAFMADSRVRMMGAGRELRGLRRDGTEVPLEIALAPLRYASNDVVLGVIADISGRRRAPASVRDSELRYQAILDNAAEAFIAMDKHGVITHWNRAAEGMLGHSSAEAIGQLMSELIIPKRLRKAHSDGVERFLGEGRRHALNRRMELMALRKDGEEIAVEVSISVLQTGDGPLFHAFMSDLTEKKRLELRIEHLLHAPAETSEQPLAKGNPETRFQRLLNNMLEGVQVLDQDLRYRYLNDSAVAQSRYTRGQLIGRTLLEMYPGVEGSALHVCLQECMEQQAPRTIVNEFQFPDGAVGHFELSIQPVPDGLLILSSDITDRRRIEIELDRKRVQLEQQNAELERFAYIASHDLQEPLRMVASYLQLLERRYGHLLQGDALEFMGFAIDGAHRMKRLITDLLAYSRADRPLTPEPVDLGEVIEDVSRDLSAAIAEAGARIEVGPQLPCLIAPRTVMNQIFLNLIGNAVKFRHADRPPVVRVSAERAGDHWIISVQDNGMGIDPEFGERVFSPLSRPPEAAGIPGTGIGLSIVRKHVTRLGGRIWFESDRATGTTFHIMLWDQNSHVA